MEETKSFTIDLIGDYTGSKWFGKFSVKKKLSHRDHLAYDKIRRDLLGADTTNDSRARHTAEVVAHLRVRIVDSPDWWKACDGGLDLGDFNVLQTLFEKAMDAEVEHLKEIRASAEKAKEELREEAGLK